MAIRKGRHRIQEFALIQALARRFAKNSSHLVQGIGDDAAVIAATTPAWWHVTTDLLAEGVHFDLRTASAESVGYRAAMANLSDIPARYHRRQDVPTAVYRINATLYVWRRQFVLEHGPDWVWLCGVRVTLIRAA